MLLICLILLTGIALYVVGRARHIERLAEVGRGVCWMGACAAGIALLVHVGGCAGVSTDRSFARAAYATASDAFVAWDLEHQHELVRAAPDADAAQAAVDAYRRARAVVLARFAAAAALIDSARSLSPAPAAAALARASAWLWGLRDEIEALP